MIYWELFFTFAQVGALMFGGGYAMLPMLQSIVVDKKHWVDEQELADYYAIGQVTPGVIAVNTATFIGKKVRGNFGGIVATLGLVSSPLVMMILISALISNFTEITWVSHAFAGIRVCVCVLILNAIIKLWKKSVVDVKTLVIFLCVFFASILLEVSPVIFVVIAAFAGIVLQVWLGGKKEE